MKDDTTPRPWKIELEHQGIRGRRENITIVAARGVVARVGDTSIPGAMENAQLIVRAVNAHDQLVAALEQAQEDTCSLHCPSVKKTGEEWTHSERCRMVSAALAKVQP